MYSNIHELTPVSEKDCFYIVDRKKTKFTYPLHHHSDCELTFCENVAGARRIVGDSSEVVGHYDLVLITAPDLEHVWEQHECVSGDIREITIQFSSDLFFKSLIGKNQFETIRKMCDKAGKGIAFPMKAIMKVYPLLDNLSSKKGFQAVLQFLNLLHELSLFSDEARALSSDSFARQEEYSDSRRIEKVRLYVNSNYKREIRCDKMAEIVGMSPCSFSRFFKLRAGKTFQEYVIDIRLGYAARALVDSTKSIMEICADCGFKNIANFNRIFKKYKLCTPKVFRENYRKKQQII
ncbi:MAG: AraC family transcriptional regulator [Bacteroidales bacterium]|jgi:AraC-like DNA-binding protein|nr:AraC family transcriptional regulator [Bacteroidales bacterium]